MTRDTSAVGALGALSWRGWVVLRDRALPGRRRGTLDHVLVGPGGVFVMSRTKWPGPVAVADGVLNLGGRPHQRDVTDLAEAAAAVLALVPDVPVHPVFCIERHQPLTGWVRNVMLCATSNVEEILTSRPAVLGPEQVQQVAEMLASRLLPVPPAATESDAVTSTRSAAPWPVRILFQAAAMAVAALLVIGVLQTGVVNQISTVVGNFVTEVATVDDQPTRKPAQDEPRTSTRKRADQGKGKDQDK